MLLKKIVFALFLNILFFTYSFAQKLNEKQKIEDFEFLYETLRQAYPLFEVAKRRTGIDWLSKKQEFIDTLKKTTSDKGYLNALNNILKELNNGHIDVFPSIFREQYIEAYKKFKIRERWLAELEKGNNYWSELYGIRSDKNGQSTFKYDSSNISLNCFDHNSIAVLKIKSFDEQFLNSDKEKLKEVLKKIKTEKVIIDIQGNGGGTEEYWRNYIVPMLSSENINYKGTPLVFRKSSFVSEFFDNDFKKEKEKVVNKTYFLSSFGNVPKEVFNNDYDIYVNKKNSVIKGKDLIKRKRKIYLLVDEGVFSSAESFALFAKETHWATVVGQTSKGDGGSFDPLLLCLPNSKIIVRFSAEMSLNADGSANAEVGTTPDIFIKGKNSEERLYNLLKKINS